jgi:7-cyano-7-deazaguanine tRNA-ribosyltransferase
MDFYISWYPGDPYYSQYDTNCALLVSITSVARDWTIRAFPRLPAKLMVDSGGYRFAVAPEEAMDALRVFQRQLEILDGAEIPTVVCARDFPTLERDATVAARDRRITETIAFAYELKNLIEKTGDLPTCVIPMGVIQGHDVDSLRYCAAELKAIGFPLYGVGSLAALRRHDLIIERIEAVTDLVPPRQLHVFGVSVIRTLRALQEMGIRSFDSARPAKAAAYNEVWYSNPYRRFGILEPGKPIKGRFPPHRRLKQPLACECPVCQGDAGRILGVGNRSDIRSRALHNYYHLKWILGR